MRKLYDLAVKTGEYTDRNGDTKGRWQNVGSVIEGSDGGQFIMLDRTFNPAGVPNPDNRSSVLVSMFEHRDRDVGGDQRQGGGGNDRGGGQQRQGGGQRQQQRQKPPADDFSDDDIPF